MRAVSVAQILGRNCPPLVQLSIRELLELNLEDTREALGIARPRFYKRCHSVWRTEGIDPYDLLAPSAYFTAS